MKTERVDRRVQRTCQLLNEALMSLIVEKGYEAITVQNIIDRTNLGRSTFYAPYQDKEDLLLSGMEKIVHMGRAQQNIVTWLGHPNQAC